MAEGISPQITWPLTTIVVWLPYGRLESKPGCTGDALFAIKTAFQTSNSMKKYMGGHHRPDLKRDIPHEIGVKQGDTMVPMLFIYLMNAFAEILSDNWHFNKLKYNWFLESSSNGNKQGHLLTGQSPKAIEMHVGHGDKTLKTECVCFPALDNEYKNADTSNFMVNEAI
eukprot:scaffold422962_cov75-Attheya_sp.AAC.1